MGLNKIKVVPGIGLGWGWGLVVLGVGEVKRGSEGKEREVGGGEGGGTDMKLIH